MHYKSLYLSFFLLLLFAGSACTHTPVVDLVSAMESGDVVLGKLKGTGVSSGFSVEGELANQTDRAINIEAYLSKSIFLKNSGVGQDMIAHRVYGRDGSYFSDGKKSFITLEPGAPSNITFVAYCYNFEKDNPAPSESFAIAETPRTMVHVMRNANRFAKQNPDVDITAATQVAVWLAQGEVASEIEKKFQFTEQDYLRANSFLK